jgi:ABC-type transport system involved in cytochrome c biogenesis permease subunit
MERALLIGSTLCFLFGFAYTMHALGAGTYRPSRLNFFAILCGFCFQTGFLYLRGQALGRCPLTNLFEVFIFLGWSMVLFYLAIGPAYRLTLLGAFTSPMVFVFQIFAMLAPIDSPPLRNADVNPWLEAHAAFSIVAYGAFALACVAGAMYLAQEFQLKTRRLRPIFFHLPPIANLAIANQRLLLMGFGLLTLGLVAGFAIGRPLDMVKISWSLCVWALYGLLMQAGMSRWLGPRRVALFSVLAFSMTLSTLWGINFISEGGGL